MKTKNIMLITMTLVFAFAAFSPLAQAVVPAPDGAYGAPSYGAGNTAEGQTALFKLTTGQYNTAIGWVSLYNVITGGFNTGVGAGALFSNAASYNTATGADALYHNVAGVDNTANGANALISNSNGNYNTATGTNALYGNISGSDNTADGVNALASNTSSYNTATGVNALELNTSGSYNTASGFEALSSNRSGVNNTAFGAQALFSNTASYNIAIGWNALYGNTAGGSNTAIGVSTLAGNQTGNFNTAVGYNSGINTNGSYNLNVGNPGLAGESNTVRLGTGSGVHTRMFLAGVRGVTTGSGDAVPVLIDSLGQLGTASSSRRFKHDIKPMDESSESILALKPVTFHYKSDKGGTPQFGLIAEEVAKVNPDLVVRDEKGEIYTVRYDAVNAMLLNEFLREHKKVEQQTREIQEEKNTITELKKGMDTVAAQLKEQASRIQRVSAQLEFAKGATQTIAGGK